MSYDSDQKAAKKAREQAASEIETDLRQVQRLHTDALTNIAMVFCALTMPPEYQNIWRSVWAQAQENHERSVEMLNRCADAVSPIAVYYPKLQTDVKDALLSLQLLTNCLRAITLLESRLPSGRRASSLHSQLLQRASLSDDSSQPERATKSTAAAIGNPKSEPPRPDPAALAILQSWSGDELRKALDTAAEIGIGHAVVLLEYLSIAGVYRRLEGLPKLSADAKGVELVPGIYLHLGTAKLAQSRLAFAIRYLEVLGYPQILQALWRATGSSSVNRPKLPKKWMEGIKADVAAVNQEELFHRVGVKVRAEKIEPSSEMLGHMMMGKKSPDPAALASLSSWSGEALRKALDTAADISIGHAVVLLEYAVIAEVYHLLERLPKLSADAKGVELVPGISQGLGLAKLTVSRLAFAVRYLEVLGLLKTPNRPKLPKKWMDGLKADVAAVDHEELLHRVGAL